MRELGLETLHHEPKRHGEWNESCYFVFYDREQSLSVLTQSFGSFELDGVSGDYSIFETLRRVR
ncbi:MAG: hypothetical protein JSV18_00950 [Candidatus Bathyarchaeota archaeon]|nr:MAG: hypothetical protein JSV18_00950 [Candidatus Bathyarchaeota archaeon]